MNEFIVLGGAEEIGANCTYLNLDGCGILIDAGLHPRERNARAFPDLSAIDGRPVDHLLITHAHTDHLGGVPFILKRYPGLRTAMTFATRDLSHVMLHNNGKLLRGDVSAHFTKEQLEYYQREQIQLIRSTFEAVDYEQPFSVRGYSGNSDVHIRFHWAGHILGSAGISLECKGKRIMVTGDVQFQHQSIVQKARFPRVHADLIITEATNCATDDPIQYSAETRRLATYISSITTQGGSILIPSFALGKTQELLGRLYSLIRKGSIPHLPIYTGGMGTKVSKVYDDYCYTEPMRVPGFEVSDIPQRPLRWETLTTDEYFTTPSIVIAPSGMVNKRTMSYVLAKRWLREPNFGIAIIGYQDPATPGYQLLHSTKGEEFDFGGKSFTRLCEMAKFRFSAHAALEDLVDYIADCTPDTVAIVHGETEACEGLARALRQRMPGLRIVIPRAGVAYGLTSEQLSADELLPGHLVKSVSHS